MQLTRRLRFLLVLALFSPLLLKLCWAQSRLIEAPELPPTGCSVLQASLLENESTSGTARSLQRHLDMLSMGHIAQQEALATSTELKAMSSGTVTSALASFIEGLETARNDYLCAAYVAGQAHADNETQRIIRDGGIAVFNRFAMLSDKMGARVVARFENPRLFAGAQAQVKQAKLLAELFKMRDESFSDLVDVTTMTTLRAIDPNQPSDQPAKYLSVSCPEQKTLLKNATELSTSEPADSFTRNADLIVALLTHYECRQ